MAATPTVHHIWTVLCHRTIEDRQTNNLSLIDVVEELHVTPPLPPEGPNTAPVRLELVSFWARSEPDQPVGAEGHVELLSPSGLELLPRQDADLDIDLVNNVRLRTRVIVAGLPLQGTGVYRFRVQARERGTTEWRVVADIPLHVSLEKD